MTVYLLYNKILPAHNHANQNDLSLKCSGVAGVARLFNVKNERKMDSDFVQRHW